MKKNRLRGIFKELISKMPCFLKVNCNLIVNIFSRSGGNKFWAMIKGFESVTNLGKLSSRQRNLMQFLNHLASNLKCVRISRILQRYPRNSALKEKSSVFFRQHFYCTKASKGFQGIGFSTKPLLIKTQLSDDGLSILKTGSNIIVR